MDAKVIKADGAEMPFEMKIFGEKPTDGRSLVISMHGGGGAPKRVNDQQWENQKKLYEIEEGIYLAPRAPTDTWNMWHQGHIDSLYTRLIENLVAIEDVNPNRVFITGYSAGGDGVFQLAPRMADQLAAAAMMAGHPNETKPDGLRNLPFTLHVGGKDSAYNRNTIAQTWSDKLAELKKADEGGYEHWAKIYPEKSHWMDREDREGIKWMMKFNRNIVPEKVVWLQDDVVHSRFYWLKVDAAKAKAGDLVVASRSGNKINIEKAPQGKLTLLLQDDMLNLDDELIVTQSAKDKGDKELWRGKSIRTVQSIADTLADRGDPMATFCAQVDVDITE
jgi:dienelactone hydrolase